MKVRSYPKQVISLILAVILVLVPLSNVNAQAAGAKWYDSVVADFTAKGFYNGTADVNTSIKQGEFVKLAVLSDTYNHAEDALTIAAERGWIQDGSLSGAALTRKQAAEIAARMLTGNPDATVQDAIELGVLVGDGKGNIRENDSITYAEAMTVLSNIRRIRNSLISTEPVKSISVEEFFAAPAAAGYIMSDDGEYLYFAGEYESRLNIFRQNPNGGVPERLTNITDKNLVGYFFKGGYLIFMADNGGDENYHLFAVEIGGDMTQKDITPYEGVRVMPMDLLGNVENEILVSMNKTNPEVFDVYKLNIVTGELTLVAENPGSVSGWLTDWNGNVRIAYVSDGIDTYIMYRDGGEGEFGLLASAGDADTLEPLAFSKDGKLLYLLSNVGRNTTSLISLDLTSGVETLIYANDDYDIAGASLTANGISNVMYYADKLKIVFFDAVLEGFYNKIAETFGTKDFTAQLSDDYSKAMVTLYSDTNPGEYYYYNMETELIIPLSQAMPWIDQSALCERIPVSYTARDGLVIHGYLTLPKNTKPENLSLVVNPHGGPWSRDIWGYNTEAQLLANQGYAVLQMNFRGSTGYGKEFLYAGDKQWGRAMQDDITDGVNWLVKIGVVNPDKVAIYGASYGGYAALAGITLTPDLYAAAVDYVGVSNLLTFMDSFPPYWEGMRQYLYDRIGDPVEDYDDLYAYSPVNLADKITTPLFVAQGANDPRVNKAESDQIVAALRARGVDVDYMVKDNEGHGFMFVENQYEFYNAMINFLAKYLK